MVTLMFSESVEAVVKQKDEKGNEHPCDEVGEQVGGVKCLFEMEFLCLRHDRYKGCDGKCQ